MPTIKGKQIDLSDFTDSFGSWLEANLLDRMDFSNSALTKYQQQLYQQSLGAITNGTTEVVFAAGAPVNYLLVYRNRLKQIENIDYTFSVDGSYNCTITFTTPFNSSGTEILEVNCFTI